MTMREINDRTSLPFKIVVPIVSTLMLGTWMICAKIATIENAIARQWTSDQQSRWSNRLRSDNPTVKVPYTDDFVTTARIQ